MEVEGELQKRDSMDVLCLVIRIIYSHFLPLLTLPLYIDRLMRQTTFI